MSSNIWMRATVRERRADRQWPVEVEVLLSCARTEVRPGDRARLDAAVDRGVDWPRVVDLARRHRIMPLLYRHASIGTLAMPEAAVSPLRAAARANARRMLDLASELAELLRLCRARGIPAAPLKGPLLAEQLYQSVALRQSGDLDVMVRPADVPAVTGLLIDRGYMIERHASPALAAVAQRDLHHVSAVHSRRSLRVELHYWLLRPRGRRTHDLDAITPWLRPFSFMGQPTAVLDGEALLAYLCEHGAEHSWSRLEWLSSVAELLRRGVRPDDGRDSFASMLGTTRRVAAARHLAATLLDASPEHDRADPLTATATRIVVRRLRRSPERVAESSAERFGYLLLTDATAAARMRRCRTMLLAPGIGDAEAVPLPPSLTALRWAIRPLRLIARRLRWPHSTVDLHHRDPGPRAVTRG